MSNKKVIVIGCLIYVGISSIFFVQKTLFANEKNHYKEIITKEKIVAKDKRAMLRAFYTAPPVVPHAVESENSKDCLTCHLNVTKLDDGRIAMQTPHPQFTSCLQCHIPSKPGGGKELDTSWEGLKEPKQGDRWFLTSPPTMPHRVVLRENCLSCHGPENPDMRLRTPHPERTSCLQCHVPDYKSEFEIQ